MLTIEQFYVIGIMVTKKKWTNRIYSQKKAKKAKIKYKIM